MEKECFEQEITSATKFRDCAECPVFDQCREAVLLKNQKGASYYGEALGIIVGFVGLYIAYKYGAAMPHGVWWLLFFCVAYIFSVIAAGKSYRGRNAEEHEEVIKAYQAA